MLVAFVPLLSFGFRSRLGRTNPGRLLLIMLLAMTFLKSGMRLFEIVERNVAQPPEWDFQSFWLYGRVAAEGLNLYDPAQHGAVVALLSPSETFVDEIVRVGFWYSPPTAFLFLPLGWMDLQTAALVWAVANLGLFLVTMVLVWKVLLPQTGFIGLGLTVAMGLAFPSTYLNLNHFQTSFFSLLCTVLFLKDRSRSRAGVWLALGFLVKPVFGLLGLYPLIRRQWGMLGAMAATLGMAYGVSLAYFGPTTFWSYWMHNPALRLPAEYFGEVGNISLYAFLWRLLHSFSNGQFITTVTFAAVALVMVLLTAWLIYQAQEREPMWALLATLAVALSLYPNTSAHYCLMLLPVICYWLVRETLNDEANPREALVVVGCLILICWGLGYNDGWSNWGVVALALTWLLAMAMGLRDTVGRPTPAAVAMAG